MFLNCLSVLLFEYIAINMWQNPFLMCFVPVKNTAVLLFDLCLSFFCKYFLAACLSSSLKVLLPILVKRWFFSFFS